MQLSKQSLLLVFVGVLMVSLALCSGSGASAQQDAQPFRHAAVEGEYTPLPIMMQESGKGLAGLDDGEISIGWLVYALSGEQFHDNDLVYCNILLDDQGALYYRAIDISTMRLSRVMFPKVFGNERILDVRTRAEYCSVLTDCAVYTFNEKLALVNRAVWPDAMRPYIDQWEDGLQVYEDEHQKNVPWSSWSVSPLGTTIVFRDRDSYKFVDKDDPIWEGRSSYEVERICLQNDYENNFIWVCELKPEATPKSILPAVSYVGEEFYEKGYNVLPHFIGENKILVTNHGWEWCVNYKEIVDLQGKSQFVCNVVEQWVAYPGVEQRMDADEAGVLMHNPTSEKEDATYYFDYAKMQVEKLLPFDVVPYNQPWEACAINGRTFVFAMRADNTPDSTAPIDFYRYAVDTNDVERLPLTLHNTKTVEFELAPDGKIVFACETYDEEEFAGAFERP